MHGLVRTGPPPTASLQRARASQRLADVEQSPKVHRTGPMPVRSVRRPIRSRDRGMWTQYVGAPDRSNAPAVSQFLASFCKEGAMTMEPFGAIKEPSW
jgi:hypothetical protein